MLKKAVTVLAIFLTTTFAHGHVGSADVYYEGDAGPYHLFVTVLLPKVIPGVAEIQVRSASADVQQIRVSSLRLSGLGSKLSPSPDVAQRSSNDPQFFVGNLWFMEYGALQVRIEADGAKGKGALALPVASFARQTFPMNRALSTVLFGFLVVLTLGAVLIAGAVVRESTLVPGELPQTSKRRRAQVVMALMLIVVLLILHRGKASWNVEAAAYERNVNLLQPPRAETTLVDGNRLLIRPAGPLLVPVAGHNDSANEVKMDDIIPDHGHLMHLFLMRMPGMQSMWHLHPDRVGGEFAKSLPAMPAGQYKVFADIVDKNGFPWTLVGDMNLPQINGSSITGDDSGWVGAPLVTPLAAPLVETTLAELPDGARMVWERGAAPLKANVPSSFKFHVEEQDGSPARDLQPYMGMAAHAEVVCSDLSVFAHIHPGASVSMAALDLAQAGMMTASPTAGSGMAMASALDTLPPNFSFPYGFPHPGDYRIFVQIKRSGEVQTAVFSAAVQ